MAVVLGTNAGFVSEAPVGNPGGSSMGQDGGARAHKHITPAGVGKITEIGWWHNDWDVGSYELGLYAHDSENDLPGDLLYSTVAENSGSAPGWETQTVDWEVNPETVYWLAIQIDAIGGDVQIDFAATGGRTSIDVGIATLQNPWVNDGITDYIVAVYAVVEIEIIYADLVGTGGGIGGGSAILGTATAVDLAGTGGGTGGGSAILETVAITNLAGTGGGVGGGSAALSVFGMPSEGAGVSRTYRRVVVAGNDKIYYEDI